MRYYVRLEVNDLVFVVYERRRSVAQVYRKRIGGERDSR
jgi:hypothetical protein